MSLDLVIMLYVFLAHCCCHCGIFSNQIFPTKEGLLLSNLQTLVTHALGLSRSCFSDLFENWPSPKNSTVGMNTFKDIKNTSKPSFQTLVRISRPSGATASSNSWVPPVRINMQPHAPIRKQPGDVRKHVKVLVWILYFKVVKSGFPPQQQLLLITACGQVLFKYAMISHPNIECKARNCLPRRKLKNKVPRSSYTNIKISRRNMEPYGTCPSRILGDWPIEGPQCCWWRANIQRWSLTAGFSMAVAGSTLLLRTKTQKVSDLKMWEVY